MKRVGGLFEQIADLRTLRYAAWRASQGKRGRHEVRQFFRDLDGETNRMGQELREERYRFGDYRSFMVRDPKSREIRAPAFRDRVMHHAIIAIAGPVLDRGAIAHTYACRKGLGQHVALSRASRWIQPGRWFLKMDVRKYYDSISHEHLLCALERRFRERRLLRLFGRLIRSYERRPGHGLPIGALTSQYLGNFYLDPLDHWVQQGLGLRRYLRYMDDMLCVGDRDEMHKARDKMRERLSAMGLEMKGEGILNRCEIGVPFLGFVLYPNRTRLNRLGRRRLRRRFREAERGFLMGDLHERTLQERVSALFAHARFGDDVGWRREVCRFSRLGETQGPASRPAGRLVEQHGQELPLGLSQQEPSG